MRFDELTPEQLKKIAVAAEDLLAVIGTDHRGLDWRPRMEIEAIGALWKLIRPGHST